MAFRKLFTTVGFIALNGAVAGLAIACAASSESDGSSDNAALTGSVSNAKACAVRDAYAAADIAAFTQIARIELPASIRDTVPPQVDSIATFNVAGVGQVFVVEVDPTTSFYGNGGMLLVTANEGTGGHLAWSRNGGALQCDGSSSSSSGSTADAGMNDGGAG